MEARYAALRRATEEVAAVDGHAHNLVDLGSAFPFTRCFCEAEGDALALAPHSLSFKVRRRALAATPGGPRRLRPAGPITPLLCFDRAMLLRLATTSVLLVLSGSSMFRIVAVNGNLRAGLPC